MFAIGSIVGLLCGGVILSFANFVYDGKDASWAVLFWVSGPVVAILTACFMVVMENPQSIRDPSKKVDFLGSIMLSLAVATLLVALTVGTGRWNKPGPILLLVWSAGMVLVFVLWEIHYGEGGIIPLRIMFGHRTVLFTNLIAFVVGYSLFTVFQTAPYMLTNALGPFAFTEAWKIGLVLFPCTVPALIVAPIVAVMSKNHSPPTLMSLMLFIFTLALLLLLLLHNTIAALVFVEMFLGVGCGGAMTLLIIVLAPVVPLRQFSICTAANLLFRIIGSSVAPILSNLFLTLNVVDVYPESSSGSALVIHGYKQAGFAEAWTVAFLLTGGAFVLSLFVPGQAFACRCDKCGRKTPAPSPTGAGAGAGAGASADAGAGVDAGAVTGEQEPLLSKKQTATPDPK
eukprot:TRINITY_DN890_c0_g1_i6.p1 TRINITY_DN890_c0_g1~~TRINITY_DN890_c0_g1_i6.p1  ORF type:complete len:411 (+),score=117.43 TRINITY_DN890_c0_g1_i6:35-1234(+)